MFKNRFTLSLTHNEEIWGIRYLLFEQVFLSWLISMALNFLGVRLTGAEFNFFFFAVNFLAVLWIFRDYLKKSLIHTAQNAAPFALAVVLGLAAYWSMHRVMSVVLYTLLPEFFNVNDAAIAYDANRQFWLTAAGTVLLVPLAEEMLFRGLLFTAFRRRSRALAYVITVTLFSCIHISGYVGLYDWWVLGLCFLQYVPAGIALAWSFEASGSIFAPVVIHTVVNLSAMLSMR